MNSFQDFFEKKSDLSEITKMLESIIGYWNLPIS